MERAQRLSIINEQFGHLYALDVLFFGLGLLILVGLCLYRDHRKEKREHESEIRKLGEVLRPDQEVRLRIRRGRN